MTNFVQNPVQATKTNKQFPQFLWDPTSYNSGRDDVNIRVHSVLAKPAMSSTNPAYMSVCLLYFLPA